MTKIQSKQQNIMTRIILSILTFLYITPATAEQPPKWVNHLIPVYDNIVVTPTPFDWQMEPVHSEGDSNFFLTEFLPKGQTVNEWKEMITISAYKKVNLSPEQYFNTMYGMTEKICGKSGTAAQVVGKTDNIFVALLMCGGVQDPSKDIAGLGADKGEMTLYRIYKVDNSLYSIFHSWRGNKYNVKDADERNLPTFMSNVKDYIINSKRTTICSRINPQGACKAMVEIASKHKK